MSEQLAVYLADQQIGLVRPARARALHLVDFEWLAGGPASTIRLTESFTSVPSLMPDSRRVSRFFGGYLPEGSQRQAMADQRQIPRDDLFAFLREYGGSIAGALSFRRPADTAGYAELTPSDLRRALKDAVGKQNQGLRDDSRSMIPGFQPKVLVARFADGGWMLPHGSAHSTHILKPPRPAAPERIVDEHFAHELAHRLGLSNYKSELLHAGDMRYLAIERFDRRAVGAEVQVLHQEDAAQAMGLDWIDDQAKFQDPRRPRDAARASAYRIAEVVAALDGDPLHTWLRQLTFRILIGDNDGHAKNVGILHEPDSDRVSDLYDAVPNLFQEGPISWDLAFAVDGEFDHRRLTSRHLIREARSWGLRESDAERTVTEILTTFRDALHEVPLPAGVSPQLQDAVGYSVDRMLAGTEIGRFDRRRGA